MEKMVFATSVALISNCTSYRSRTLIGNRIRRIEWYRLRDAGTYGYRKCAKSRSKSVEVGPQYRASGSHIALSQHLLSFLLVRPGKVLSVYITRRDACRQLNPPRYCNIRAVFGGRFSHARKTTRVDVGNDVVSCAIYCIACNFFGAVIAGFRT